MRLQFKTSNSLKLLNAMLLLAGMISITGCKSWQKDSDPKPTTYQCEKAGKIIIDGKLNEASWNKAVPVEQCYEINNPPKGPQLLPPGTISTKFLHDDKYLYVGAVIRDQDIVANPKSVKREDPSALILDGDVYELFLQPDAKDPVYYEYHVNPLNAGWSARYEERAGYKVWESHKWQKAFKHAAKVIGTVNKIDNDTYWTVEAAIPLKDITLLDGKQAQTTSGTKWRFSVCTYDYQFYFGDRDNASTLKYKSSSPYQRISFHDKKFFNYIIFK